VDVTRRKFLYLGAVAAAGSATVPALWALFGRSAPEEGAPAIDYGHDRCEACGMVIGDSRFAAAARGDGVAHRYDDIGCLIMHSRAALISGAAAPYVHDAATGRWIDGRRATYVRTSAIRSPMGYGLEAYATPKAARAAHREAQMLTFDALAARLAQERS
jgi:copper chaperone NosL